MDINEIEQFIYIRFKNSYDTNNILQIFIFQIFNTLRGLIQILRWYILRWYKWSTKGQTQNIHQLDSCRYYFLDTTRSQYFVITSILVILVNMMLHVLYSGSSFGVYLCIIEISRSLVQGRCFVFFQRWKLVLDLYYLKLFMRLC